MSTSKLKKRKMATDGTILMTQEQNSRVYLLRLQMLIIDGSRLVLTHLLDQRLTAHGITFDVCVKRERATIERLKSRGIITQDQYDLLFPYGGIVPSTSDLDMRLIICLLRTLHFFGFKRSFDWSKQPASTDESMEADIYRLKFYCKMVTRCTTTTAVTHNDFVVFWNDIERILVRLSPPSLNIEQKIYEFRTFPLGSGQDSRSVEIQEETTLQQMEDSAQEGIRSCTDGCVFDGRLIELSDYETKCLDKENTIEIGHGSFGKVYKSNTISKHFGMHVVVKKIILNDINERSIKREMITSRVLHPFILPLLAVVKKPMGKQEVWFVSPLCSKGDLNTVLKEGNWREGERINARNRVKILLQIALAIKYIHTPVDGIRDTILHKDVSSKNVVLDENYNARLIDFGSAREKNDDTTMAGGRICYSHPDIGSGTFANESWDYYSFGVIIREMLTSLAPEGENKFLMKMSPEEVENVVDKKIWTKSSQDQVEMLNEIAKSLLLQNDWKVSDFTKSTIEKLNQLYRWFGRKGMLDFSERNQNKKCHCCMINEKARRSSMNQMHSAICDQKIEVCIACEKNSFLNPIACYCGVQLTPDIGSKWGALLVSGKDTKNVEITKALVKDVTELEKLLTSHAPRVFGISKENICTVVPCYPDNIHDEEQLWPKVKKCMELFSVKENIDTLLIFFSCHGEEKSNEFRLGGDSDIVTREEYQKLLESLNKVKNLIIILDRCFPPIVQFQESKRIYFQINSCRENEQANMNADGSIFTKFLIRGLKAKSEGTTCSTGCQHCLAYWKNNTDFIKFQSLVEYINDHIKDEQYVSCSFNQYDRHSNIAFYTGERVFIRFISNICGKAVYESIPLDHMRDIDELKEKLKEVFGQKEKIVTICIHSLGRKKEPWEYCNNLEKVMLSWVQRQELEVIFK